MTERRRFVIGPADRGQVISLGVEESAHMTRVLRIGAGETVEGVDGHGWVYVLRLRDPRGRKAIAEVELKTRAHDSRPLNVIMATGLLKGRRMDWAVEKAAELGARAFVPFTSERSVASTGPAGTRTRRWRRIAISALKQSLGAYLMHVSAPREFEHVLKLAGAVPLALAGDAEGGPLSLRGKAGRGTACLLVIGPEGGLSAGERRRLARCGAEFFSLGADRLRSETAVTASLAALWHACA